MTLKISDIGEKELIRYIISNSRDITPDDTAITPLNNSNLISTTDMLIQSRHFPENMSYHDMGFKAVTVNVSDLAAMGAEPLGFLLAIALLPQVLNQSSLCPFFLNGRNPHQCLPLYNTMFQTFSLTPFL